MFFYQVVLSDKSGPELQMTRSAHDERCSFATGRHPYPETASETAGHNSHFSFVSCLRPVLSIDENEFAPQGRFLTSARLGKSSFSMSRSRTFQCVAKFQAGGHERCSPANRAAAIPRRCLQRPIDRWRLLCQCRCEYILAPWCPLPETCMPGPYPSHRC